MSRYLLLLGLLGCSSQGHQATQPDSSVALGQQDSDLDGLCDATEAEAGTDPTLTDSDGDTLPDGLEQVLGFSPLDDTSPTADQLVQASVAVTLGVNFTVEGMGESLQGVFLPISSPFSTEGDALSLLTSARALEALPADNVRAVQPEAQRFETVTGSTRLSFELTFDLSMLTPLPCTVAHPFAYGLFEVGGGLVKQQKYLLVIAGEATDGRAPGFCPPANCI